MSCLLQTTALTPSFTRCCMLVLRRYRFVSPPGCSGLKGIVLKHASAHVSWQMVYMSGGGSHTLSLGNADTVDYYLTGVDRELVWPFVCLCVALRDWNDVLAGDHTTPDGLQHEMNEQVVRVGDLWMFAPRLPVPSEHERFDVRNSCDVFLFIFACLSFFLLLSSLRLGWIVIPLQMVAKYNLFGSRHFYLVPRLLNAIHVDFDDVLGSVLAQDPAGEVMIMYENQQEVRQWTEA
jgi:hypothetical protein